MEDALIPFIGEDGDDLKIAKGGRFEYSRCRKNLMFDCGDSSSFKEWCCALGDLI